MATVTNKMLGQHQAADGNFATLYAVPPATRAIVSISVSSVTEISGGNATIAIAVAGASDATAQQIYHSLLVGPSTGSPGRTFVVTGLGLGPGDVVRVKSNLFGGVPALGTVFQAYGMELS